MAEMSVKRCPHDALDCTGRHRSGDDEMCPGARAREHKRIVLRNARVRADARGASFTLTIDDLPPVPETCPVLGIALVRNHEGPGPCDTSPSLDRIFPELGYVPGNVRWISQRANQIKSNATSDGLWLVVQDSLRLDLEDLEVPNA
jgi:hypothetical protein